MRKLLLIGVFTCTLCGTLSAQLGSQSVIDSLHVELDKATADTTRIRLLLDLAHHYPYVNPDAGIRFAQQALNLSAALALKEEQADAYSALGANYVQKSEYATAIDYEYKALQMYEDLGDSAKQAVMNRNLSIVHHRSKNSDEALKYAKQSLDFYEALHDSEGIAAIYTLRANVYYRLKDSALVVENNLKALEIYQATHNGEGEARIIGNMANFYAINGDFGTAMVYYFDALRREELIGNTNGVIRNWGNIGETYLDIARAEEGSVKPDSLIPNGKAANLKLAIEYLERCVRESKETQQTEYYLAFAETLSSAYMLAGQTDIAFKLYKEYVIVKDSIYDVDKYNEQTRKQLDYEYGEREDSLRHQEEIVQVKLSEEQKSRKRENIFYGVGLVLVIIFSVFMFNRWRITRKQKVIIEAEQQKSESLLLNILPAETAHELKEKGKSDARLMDQVTVLFTDFKGFTQYAEKLSPQELVSEINECFSAFDSIMEKYGVEKIKTIGDSYMAAGGLPTSNTTHATDVVNAAIEINEFMLGWMEKKSASGREFFEIRIGIHTGPVVAGIVGIKKFQYDIWGDTVNIASRMESNGEPGKINISQTTYELVKDKFTCVPRGKIVVKGKGEMEMYWVE